jgi:hypothetical protein
LAGALRPEKNLQSSGRLCFSAGSNYNRNKLRPEKKGTLESSDQPFFPAGSNYNQKKLQPEKQKVKLSGRWKQLRFGGNVTTGKKNVQLSGRLYFSAGSKNNNQKKLRPEKRYSRLAVSWKLEKIHP